MIYQSLGKYMEKAPQNLSSASHPKRFTPGEDNPWYQFDMKLGMFQSRYEFFGEQTNVLPPLEIKPRF